MNRQFYKGKKVFLTGHTGFKGSWLTVWLELLGAKVKGYALRPDKISLFNQIKNHLKCESVIADIRNKERLQKELLSFQPDLIFHLAAQAIVRESYRLPVDTFEVNTIGTANLLNALRDLKKQCIVVIVTTDKVYENPETGKPFAESDPLGGHDPYSASKAAAEIVTESFRLSFFHPSKFKEHKKAVAVARAGNVIGGGDYAKDRIVPDIYHALSESKAIQVRNPNAVRPWQHVLEPLSGYLTLADKMSVDPVKHSTAYNFGPSLEDNLTVEELVKESITCWGRGRYEYLKIKNPPHEAGLLQLDISKAKRELKWVPQWNSSKAVEKTMTWYKDSLTKKLSKFELCIADIQSYKL